jgi:hypothetical protein
LEAVIRPQIEPEHWNSRSNYPALGLLPTGAGELSVYLNQAFAQPRAHVQRYSYERDRLACFEAGHRSGELLTHPLLLPGGELWLNLATAAAGSALVELLDAEGAPLPGHHFSDCVPLIGNGLELPVRWSSGTDLTPLAGQVVRLRIRLREARLHALRFTAGIPAE